MKRTHTCGDLRKKDIKKNVKLTGWNNSRRDHGGIIFIDLRDRYGITQAVFDPKHNKEVHKKAEHLGREDVLFIEGKVRARGKELENPNLNTGEIEILADKLEILNKADTPPLEIDDRKEANEDMRLKYRYLDLRRPVMQKNILVRYKTTKSVRDFFDKEGFLEIETPIMAKSTPEGARDYLVPSRVHAGKFYALPQSPQLFKQLLMVSGFDRYFQIARCFRDEDLRADRQPEFTQIDVEMSFIDEEDIYGIMDRMLKQIWKEVLDVNLKIPFPRMTYQESMEKYGSDKPDTRFDLFLMDLTEIVKGSDFKVFTSVISLGGKVKGINAKSCAGFSRKEIEELTELVGIYGAQGLAWIKITDKGPESSIVKFFDGRILNNMIKKMDARKGDLLLFVADPKHHVVDVALGELRLKLGRKLNLIDNKKYNFMWVTDFPLVEFDEDEQKHIAIHHPFTSPKDEDMELLDKEPAKAKSKAYDITLNGVEIGGGSIRIHEREIQEKMFNILGISKEKAEERFGFLLDAFRYGAPPHGGIAFGLDRIATILTGNESIREVIVFPKNKAAQSLMEDSPSEVDDEQLNELNIKMDLVKKKEKNAVFEKIIGLLNMKGIKYEVMEHKPVYTSKEAAEIRGTELRQGCKALICRTEKGFVQAVVSGDKELDFEKLKNIMKVKNVELADAKQVKKVSDCNMGSVPPFGNLFNIPVYLDKKVTENKVAAFNAGSHTRSIKMSGKDLIKVTGAKVEEFSR